MFFTFESEEAVKNRVVYTDNSVDEDGNMRVFASIYNSDVNETKLIPIETEKEWRII